MITLGWWENKTKDEIINSFEIYDDYYNKVGEIDRDIEILLAWYEDVYSYSGDAFVLFKKNGEYFTVEGSHCSCFGLEGQWTPIKTIPQELIRRTDIGLGVLDDEDFFKTHLLNILLAMEN